MSRFDRMIARASTNVEIMKKSFKVSLTYRMDILFEILSTALGFYIQLVVWRALYGGRESFQGIPMDMMVCYLLVSGFVTDLSQSNIAFKIAAHVREGTIGNQLVRPTSYKHMIMFDEIGDNLFHVLCIRLPVIVAIGVLMRVPLPISPVSLALFPVAVTLGVMLTYTLNFIYGILVFWVKTPEYVTFISRALMTLFSGRRVPLWFYPSALLAMANVLPFRYIAFEPMQIFLGRVDTAAAVQIIAIQCLWIVVLMAVQSLMWRGVQKHIVVQGG